MSLRLKLDKFIRERPAYRNVPFIVVEGKPVTLMETYKLVSARIHIFELTAKASRAPTLEETWILTEAFYKRMLSYRHWERYAPNVIMLLHDGPTELTMKEMYEHIRRRDGVGKNAMRVYSSLLKRLRRRMRL